MSRSLRQPPAQDWHSLLLEAIQQRDAALAVTLAQRCVHRHGMAALDTLLERADATVEQEGDARSWLFLLLKQGSPGAAAQPGRSHPPAGGSPPSSPPLERPEATSDPDQAPTPPPPSNQTADQTLDTVATSTHDSTPAHDSTSDRASPPALDPASPEPSASAFEAASAVSAFLGVDVLSPRPWAPAPEARAAAPSPAAEAVVNASWPPGIGSAPGSAFSAGHALGSDSASAHSTAAVPDTTAVPDLAAVPEAAADPGPAIVADTALALDTPPVHGITPAPERTPAVEKASAPERAPSPETVPAPDGPPAQAGASVSAALDQAFAPLEIAFPPLPRRDWPEVTTPAAVASPPPPPLTVPAFREPSAPLEAADPEASAQPAGGIDLPREPEPLLEAFEEGVAAAPVPAFQGDAPPVALEPLPSRKRRQPEAPKDQPAPVAKSLEGWRAWLPGAFRSRQRP